MRQATALLAVMVVCPSCTPESSRDAVERHRTKTGYQYFDCGAATVSTGCSGLPTNESNAFGCFTNSFANCQPAVVQLTAMTDEGAPVVTHYFVDGSRATGCTVYRIRDDSEDKFASAPGVHEDTCQKLASDLLCARRFTVSDCAL